MDLEQVAADFDAKALAEAGIIDPAQAGKGEGPAAAEPAADTPLQKFIRENYDGDENAFLASQYESRRELKRLSSELDGVKQQIASRPRDTAAELKAARDADSDVQALDHDIKAIDSANTGLVQRQNTVLTQIGEFEKQIPELEAQLAHTDDTKEWSKLFAKSSSLRVQLASLIGEFQTNEAKLASNNNQKSNLRRELVRAERAVEDQMAQTEQAAADDAATANFVRAAFKTSFDDLIKPYGLDVNSEQFKFARESVRTLLADHLDRRAAEMSDEGLDAAGIREAVGKLIGRFAAAAGVKVKAAAPPAPPRRTTPAPVRPVAVPSRLPAAPPSTPPPAARSTEQSDPRDDPDFWRRRASTIFGAAGRQSQRGR